MRVPFLAAVLALTISAGATAGAQAPNGVRIRGTIASFANNVLTVNGAAETYKVALPENVRLSWVLKSDLSKIGPNTYVGTVAVPQPDGTLRATEVQVFPEAERGVGEGNHPWDTVPNGTMTNATVTTIAPETVDKVDGRMMSVKYKDVEKRVFVPANAPIVTFAPADRSALAAGAHVLIFATRNGDGVLTAASVQVGKDGLTPPM